MTDTAPADIGDMTVSQLAELGEETKKTFKLGDYTKKITSRQERVLLFLDQQALDNWVAANKAQEFLAAQIATLSAPKDAKRRAELQETYDAAEIEEEALHVAALQSAISLHLQALPNIAIQVVRKQARKGYEDDKHSIPDESVDEVNDLFDRLVVARQVTQIVNSEGAVADDVSEDTIRDLIDGTSPVQRKRIIDTSKMLQYTDQVGQMLIDGDPGF